MDSRFAAALATVAYTLVAACAAPATEPPSCSSCEKVAAPRREEAGAPEASSAEIDGVEVTPACSFASADLRKIDAARVDGGAFTSGDDTYYQRPMTPLFVASDERVYLGAQHGDEAPQAYVLEPSSGQLTPLTELALHVQGSFRAG